MPHRPPLFSATGELSAEVEPATAWRGWVEALRAWFDTSAAPAKAGVPGNHIDWLRAVPFIGMHLACLAVFWVGVSKTAVGVAVGLYVVRMFAITGFYHRYFAHRTFKASRPVQFLFAVIGASSVQRGPLWWAAHHRNHHRYSDTALDPHSPSIRGFFWSHIGWFLTTNGFRTDWARIPDLARFRELRWLDRYDVVVPVLLAAALYGSGVLLQHMAPQLHTGGGQLLTWGFFISTVLLFHATVTVNSLAHGFGTRRFDTKDDSRNNLLVALITMGEGWHNNHHHYPGAARQGFRWWEVDMTYYGLCLLRALGLVSNLRKVPARVTTQARD